MSPLIDPVEMGSGATTGLEATAPGPIITTLYDLIDAIQAVTEAADAVVVATVLHLFRSGRVTWHGDIVPNVNWKVFQTC